MGDMRSRTRPRNSNRGESIQREVFAPARGRGIGVGFVTLLFVVCMGSIVPACETDDGGGDGGAGGGAAGGTGGGGEAGAGGTGGDGGGGGSGGTGGAGGEESECASICATLLACPVFGDEGGGDLRLGRGRGVLRGRRER